MKRLHTTASMVLVNIVKQTAPDAQRERESRKIESFNLKVSISFNRKRTDFGQGAQESTQAIAD